jgi:hypothetical protein
MKFHLISSWSRQLAGVTPLGRHHSATRISPEPISRRAFTCTYAHDADARAAQFQYLYAGSAFREMPLHFITVYMM